MPFGVVFAADVHFPKNGGFLIKHEELLMVARQPRIESAAGEGFRVLRR